MFPRRLFLLLFCHASMAMAAVDFSHQVVPVLRKHCAECHAGDKKKGGFSINTRESFLAGSENGPVATAGQPKESRLLEVIHSDDADERMPPKGPRLSAEETSVLEGWVREGLPWQDGFAFQPPSYEPPLLPRIPELPPPTDGRTHPIDRILDAYLARNGRPRPAPIDDATFARRIHLDLTGLLPSPEVLNAFIADAAPNKREIMIRSLLADDMGYAEHWLTFWNDLLRNDYGGTGFITGGRRQISKWLYDALISNKPLDRFASELIAPPSGESRGYIDGIRWRGDVSAGQTVEIQFAQSISQTFLGINLKCASCHDSFIDRWKLDEAYGLAAIYATAPLEIARCDKPTGRFAKAAWLFPELGEVDATAPQPERLRQLAKLMTDPRNGRFTRTLVNRLWHRLMGRGIVHPVDAMQTEPWSPDLLDHLAAHLANHKYDIKSVLAHIATSQAYQSRSEVLAKNEPDGPYLYAGPRAKRLTAEQFVDAVWQITGTAPARFDAPILRGKPDLGAADAPVITAQWIWGESASKGVPAAGETLLFRKTIKVPPGLTSAAAVVTCDNSYKLYLNGRLISSGETWQALESVALTSVLKEGNNALVVVAGNAGAKPNAAGLFFQARLLFADGTQQTVATDGSWQAHKNVPASREGRLGAVPQKGWAPATVVPALPAWKSAIDAKAPGLLAQAGHSTSRMVRASLLKSDFLMRSLGRPNRDQIVSTRPNDLTTLEAIDLSNGATLAALLDQGAKSLAAKSWPTTSAFVEWLYQASLSRAPTPAEQRAAEEIIGPTLGTSGIADLTWSVLMLPEFQLIR